MKIRSICPAGVFFTAKELFINPDNGEIIISCDYENCSHRDSPGCKCARNILSSAVVLKLKFIYGQS